MSPPDALDVHYLRHVRRRHAGSPAAAAICRVGNGPSPNAAPTVHASFNCHSFRLPLDKAK
jgi:hypothetical protein